MNSPAEDIKDIIELSSSGLSLVFATDLFVSKMKEDVNQCVCIYDGPGGSPEANYDLDYPTVQVRVRGNRMAYREAYALANDIKQLLHGMTNETINGTRYIEIVCSGDIMHIGYDESERPIFSVNFDIMRTPAT
jgi:hypothetical protein